MNFSPNNFLQLLQKSLSTTESAPFIKEDLEVEAYNTLWSESDPEELRLLKMLPRVEAKAVAHLITRLVEYSGSSGNGFYGEKSLPQSGGFSGYQKTVNIRLLGEIAKVFELARLESKNSIKILGADSVDVAQERATRLAVLKKLCRQTYQSKTKLPKISAPTTYQTMSLRWAGLGEQIDDGTNGTDDPSGEASPLTHIIDLEGAPLTPKNIKAKMAEAAQLFGKPSCLFMPPMCLEEMEDYIDAKERLEVPNDGRRKIVGTNVGGIRTQGGIVYFEPDNTLSPIHYQGTPPICTSDDATPATPTAITENVTLAASVDANSKFKAADAGVYWYKITRTVNEVESLAKKSATSVTVAAGQKVTITVGTSTGIPAGTHTVKVYRTTKNGGENGTYYCIAEYYCDATGVQTIDDLNETIAGTSEVFGLNIHSTGQRALQGMSYEAAIKSVSGFAPQALGKNTIALAVLGPFMGVFELAKIYMTPLNDLLFIAATPQVMVPTQNYVWKNVGGGLSTE